jgi:hypothetical protein
MGMDAFALGSSRLDDLGSLGSVHLCLKDRITLCHVLEVCQRLGLYVTSSKVEIKMAWHWLRTFLLENGLSIRQVSSGMFVHKSFSRCLLFFCL